MGRQYGFLMREELQAAYDELSATFSVNGESFIAMLNVGKQLFAMLPASDQDMLLGIAETSGLGVDKEKILNAIDYYDARSMNCTAVAAWGPHTPGGGLVIGRNYDCQSLSGRHVAVTVLNPGDGRQSTAVIGYAGVVYVSTGMNASGVFAAMNNAILSAGICDANANPYGPVTLQTLLESSTDLGQFAAGMLARRPDQPSIVNAADSKRAASIEWQPAGSVSRRPDADGLVVSTNHFVDPYWGVRDPLPGAATAFTIERRSNLLEACRLNRGGISSNTVMKMLAMPLGEGGAFLPGATSYQVVAVPEQLKVFVRVPGHQDWVAIELGSLFTK
jgi:hypothetical protein